MPVLWIVLIVFAAAAIGYAVARNRALASAGGNARGLHSLPSYYGWNAVLMVVAPSMLVLAAWLIVAPVVIGWSVAADLPNRDAMRSGDVSLAMSDIGKLAQCLTVGVREGAIPPEVARGASLEGTDIRETCADLGIALGSDVTRETLTSAQAYRAKTATSALAMGIAVLALAALGFGYAAMRSNKDFRARNVVERGVLVLLVMAASIAILTTIGIVLSLIFNTVAFFQLYPAAEFFFSPTWNPSFGGGSTLGILPLLWGTLYISLIALVVAVPIGLFTAIYLSEYAGPRLRAVAKPAIEVLAGIPTIVYGLFALLTVGPMLMAVFGRDGIGWMQEASSVMTAGLVMGIMLIPFVSSLSDDIINAVPQSLRDGSLRFGRDTRPKRCKPGDPARRVTGHCRGAILLAASRAIGETMIVVLGAGAAARLSLNPFEAMTTVTAKIVSQLTGDDDFASPEVLVAFALGTTLFVITLCMNVGALYIVRKYREQYE
jgi:phosphate transport system permease protein